MTSHSPRSAQRTQSSGKVISALFACSAVIVSSLFWSQALLSHGSVTTTVLFDREIVRILDKHCVMCHSEGSLSFPLETYEQTWLQGKKIRAGVLARHMPPWAPVAGYGQFANENRLTLRESQFIVSWVEGLGPRNAGTVFANVVDAGARPPAVRAVAHSGHWPLAEPDLTLVLPPTTIEPRQPDEVRRIDVPTDLASARWIRGLEFVPGDRRVVRAAFFSVQETGQWIGSWTPWYGFVELPAGAAYRLPAGSHVVAEIHYRGASEAVVDGGMLGLLFARTAALATVSDIRLEAKGTAAATGRGQRFRGEMRVAADTHAFAFRPDSVSGVKSLEVALRTPDGGTEVLLYANDLPADWPTPYLFATPRLLRRNSVLSVTAYRDTGAAPLSFTISRY